MLSLFLRGEREDASEHISDSRNRVDRPTKEEMDFYVERALPIIITGMVEDWPAFKNWKDPRYLIDKVDLQLSLNLQVGKDHVIPVRTHFTKYKTGTEWLGDGVDLPFGRF